MEDFKQYLREFERKIAEDLKTGLGIERRIAEDIMP